MERLFLGITVTSMFAMALILMFDGATHVAIEANQFFRSAPRRRWQNACAMKPVVLLLVSDATGLFVGQGGPKLHRARTSGSRPPNCTSRNSLAPVKLRSVRPAKRSRGPLTRKQERSPCHIGGRWCSAAPFAWWSLPHSYWRCGGCRGVDRVVATAGERSGTRWIKVKNRQHPAFSRVQDPF